MAATENVFLSTLRDVSRGLDVIEDALKVASSGDLTQVPFPLVGRDAQIHLDARKGAYLHVLEMCSAESLKKWLAQEQMAVPDERTVLAKLREAAEGLDVIEVALKACTNGDLSQAPFPLRGQEARIHLDAQGGAYLHALEMCSAESVQELLSNFIDEQRLEELKALGFDGESDYQIHRRLIHASRALGAKLKADSIAAGSTAFDHPEERFEIEVGPDEVESAMSASNPMRSFEYQLLGRLQQDCEYYLGAGGQNKRHLWALDEIQQIQKMKELYHDLPVKPVWITLEAIKEYEEKMVSTFGKPNTHETEHDGKVTNSRDPNQVYETGSDDTCWYSKVIREGERFNVRVYDADGDRRLDREDSFADKTLAAAFADKSVLRLSDREVSKYTGQPTASQGKADDLKNTLGQVATAPFYIWANEDCANKTNSFKEAKAIRLALFNDGGESVHIVDADGVEVVDAEIEAHEALVNADYYAGARKPDVKPEFPGAFMVNDPLDPDGYAIVGDDIAALILEARGHLLEPASEREGEMSNCTAHSVVTEVGKSHMNHLSALRKETIEDPASWQASNPGQLAWIEVLDEHSGRRVDKLTYTLGEQVEFVLCVDNRHSASLFYFAEDFTATQAEDFLQLEASSFVEALRAMRAQSNDRSDQGREQSGEYPRPRM